MLSFITCLTIATYLLITAFRSLTAGLYLAMVSIYWVGLSVPPWLLVIGASQTSHGWWVCSGKNWWYNGNYILMYFSIRAFRFSRGTAKVRRYWTKGYCEVSWIKLPNPPSEPSTWNNWNGQSLVLLPEADMKLACHKNWLGGFNTLAHSSVMKGGKDQRDHFTFLENWLP